MLASAVLALCHLVLLTQQVASGKYKLSEHSECMECMNICSKPILPGKECGQPGQPAHGRLVSTEVLFYPGEEVTYSCDPGYVLTGSERRLCGEDGAWSGALPACSEWIILWSH